MEKTICAAWSLSFFLPLTVRVPHPWKMWLFAGLKTSHQINDNYICSFVRHLYPLLARWGSQDIPTGSKPVDRWFKSIPRYYFFRYFLHDSWYSSLLQPVYQKRTDCFQKNNLLQTKGTLLSKIWQNAPSITCIIFTLQDLRRYHTGTFQKGKNCMRY